MEKNRSSLPYLLIFAIGALFSYTVPHSFSEGEDSLAYIYQIMQANDTGKLHHLFTNPNHLLMNVIPWGVTNLFSIGPWEAFVGVNLISSLLVLLIVVHIARRAGYSVHAQCMAVLFCALPYAYWSYSLQAETYILPLIGSMLAIDHLLHAKEPSWRRLAILLGMSILLHQQQVLLAPALVVIAYNIDKKISLQNLIQFSLLLTLLIGGAYTFCGHFFFGLNTPEEIYGYSKGLLGKWQPSTYWNNPIKALIGIGKAYWGGYVFFYFGSTQELLLRLFPHHNLGEEIFLTQHLAPFAAWCSLFTIILGVVLTPFLLRKKTPFYEISVAWCWTALFVGLFVLYWEPQNIEFWIMLIPITALWIAGRLQQPFYPAYGIIFCLLAGNLASNILPLANPKNDLYSASIGSMRPLLQKDDLIFSLPFRKKDGHHVENYIWTLQLRVQTHAQIASSRAKEIEEVFSQIKEHPGRRILLSSWTFQFPTKDFDLLENDPDKKELFSLLEEASYSVEEIHTDSHQRIWAIIPSKK